MIAAIALGFGQELVTGNAALFSALATGYFAPWWMGNIAAESGDSNRCSARDL